MCLVLDQFLWGHSSRVCDISCFLQNQGSHRLEKYMNLEGFLEKSLKIKSALNSTGKPLKSLEKSLNSTILRRKSLVSTDTVCNNFVRQS